MKSSDKSFPLFLVIDQWQTKNIFGNILSGDLRCQHKAESYSVFAVKFVNSQPKESNGTAFY